jgi:hypothetical protein
MDHDFDPCREAVRLEVCASYVAHVQWTRQFRSAGSTGGEYEVA